MDTLVGVDPHHARAKVLGKAVRTCDVLSPKTRAQAVLRAVGDRERLLVIAECQDGHERPKYLLLSDPIAGLGAHDGRLDEAACRQMRCCRPPAAGKDNSALLASDIDEG